MVSIVCVTESSVYTNLLFFTNFVDSILISVWTFCNHTFRSYHFEHTKQPPVICHQVTVHSVFVTLLFVDCFHVS